MAQQDKGSFKSSKVIRKRKRWWKRYLHQLNGSLDYIFEQLNLNIKAGSSGIRTIVEIREGIDLKGYNLWILLASALLACIGLDTNSAAVIIGAMLISPLMNPILGVGLGFGIDDPKMLFRSLKNLGIAVVMSLTTSVIYFKFLTPLGDLTPEINARTTPTVLDVLVAFFGGIAGIVTNSRAKASNAIPGVAIATALMPPLCSAGFGLANFRWEIFGGAFYLFFINAVFISLSTFLIVKYLGFDRKDIKKKARVAFEEEAEKQRKREIARLQEEKEYADYEMRIAEEGIKVDDDSDNKFYKGLRKLMPVFVIISVIPSIIFLFSVIREANEKRTIEQLVNEELGKKYQIINSKIDRTKQTKEKAIITVLVQSEKEISAKEKKRLQKQLEDKSLDYKLQLTRVNISAEDIEDLNSRFSESFFKQQSELDKTKAKLEKIEQKLDSLLTK